MGLTQTQLVEHQAIRGSLTELGKLYIEHSGPRTDLMHAKCADVEILRANGERHGIEGASRSADDAVMALWNMLLDLPLGDAVLVRGSRNDRRLVRWDNTCMEWVDVKK